MSRILLLTLVLTMDGCSSKTDYENMELIIPVGNRCGGCVKKIVNLVDGCNPNHIKIIFTSIYTRSDMNYAMNLYSQNKYNCIVDSTNQYSSLERVSVYPVLYGDDNEILVFDPNNLEFKMDELKSMLNCDGDLKKL